MAAFRFLHIGKAPMPQYRNMGKGGFGVLGSGFWVSGLKGRFFSPLPRRAGGRGMRFAKATLAFKGPSQVQRGNETIMMVWL
jgi:hypothetical protein